MGDVGARPGTGLGIYHRRDITGSIVTRVRSLLVLSAVLGLMIATLTAMQPTPEPGNYVGPGSCAATACHGAIRSGFESKLWAQGLLAV